MCLGGCMMVKYHSRFFCSHHDEAVNGEVCNNLFSNCLYQFNM